MEGCDAREALLEADHNAMRASVSDGSSGYESTDVSDTESIKSCETREVYEDEPEIMTFRSLHSLGHSLSFITEVPELCDVKFLVGENEVPVYGVKAIMGTRSRSFFNLILKHMKSAEEKENSTPRKNNRYPRIFQHLEIPVRRYDPGVFRRLLQFVHSGSVNITIETVVGVMCGAVQFEFKDLEEACMEMVQRGITRGFTEILITSARNYRQHRTASDLLSMVIYSPCIKRILQLSMIELVHQSTDSALNIR
ncbi:hypothetical protein ACJMK2_023427 [Sinanodonta woodiana]|uniref:BTB domain-containing protein n=1 Tax=Sinanodonta woodiana TaxID=1069815 RepID=A0ABD3T469_SINWO